MASDAGEDTASCADVPEDDSGDPVNYATGEMRLGFTDIHITSYGRDWTYTRNYGNRSAETSGSDAGFGWSVSFIPTLTIVDTLATLTSDPQTVYFFDLVDGQWVARYYFRNRLFLTLNDTDPAHPRYELETPRGRTYYFDAAATSALKAFLGTKEPNGDLVDCAYEPDGLRRLTSTTRLDAGHRTGFFYAYADAPS
jgi:hypothetical protein